MSLSSHPEADQLLAFKSTLKITGRSGKRVLSVGTCFFEIPDSLAVVVMAGMKTSLSIKELANILQLHEPELTPEEALTAIVEQFIGQGLLDDEEDPKAQGSLIIGVPLIPEHVVAGITYFTHVLFQPIAFLSASLLGVVAIFYSLAAGLVPDPESMAPALLMLQTNDLVTLWLATTFGVFCHELGHASALMAQGKRPGNIGVGIYIIFLAFYSDTSRAWELPPRQRVWVDLGGVQAQLQLHVVLVFLATGWFEIPYLEAIHLEILMFSNIAGIVVNLIPALVFDGQWLAADLFGINNMREKEPILAKSLWNRWINRSSSDTEVNEDVSHLSPKMQKFLLGFLCVSRISLMLIFVYLFIYSASFFSALPNVLQSRWTSFLENFNGGILNVFFYGFPILVIILMAGGLMLFYAVSILKMYRFSKKQYAKPL